MLRPSGRDEEEGRNEAALSTAREEEAGAGGESGSMSPPSREKGSGVSVWPGCFLVS